MQFDSDYSGGDGASTFFFLQVSELSMRDVEGATRILLICLLYMFHRCLPTLLSILCYRELWIALAFAMHIRENFFSGCNVHSSEESSASTYPFQNVMTAMSSFCSALIMCIYLSFIIILKLETICAPVCIPICGSIV